MDILAGALILAGAIFAAIAGIGQLRYDDVFVRIHVATKPATIGLMLVLTGALLSADGLAPSVKFGLAIGLQFLTAPVAAHLVGRAAYRAGAAEGLDLAVDELADAPIERESGEADPGGAPRP